MSLTKASYSMISGIYLNVNDYGADPTGVADSTTAIQAAIDAALTTNQTVVAVGTYKTTAKLVIKGNTDFSNAIFNVYGTPAVAVEISTGSATNPLDQLFDATIWMPQEINNMTKPATGWAGQGVGVRTVNLYSCKVFFGRIKDFMYGLLVTAYSTGNAYNEYFIGNLNNNYINLTLSPGDSTGFTNENNFYGGRYQFQSAEGTSISGTRQIYIPNATSTINNNVFYKPCVEGDEPEYHIECDGQYNTFIQTRFEATTPKVLYYSTSADAATYNAFIGGYRLGTVQFTFSGSGSSYDNVMSHAPDNNCHTGSSSTGIIKYRNASDSTYPIITTYDASTKPETATSTQWTSRYSSYGLKGKLETDSDYRIYLNWQTGYVNFGDGAGASAYLRKFGSSLGCGQTFSADVDNTYNLGSGSFRWGTVYAGTGTINTSDENEKTDIRPLDYKEKAVALAIKARIKAFKFNDAVEAKGDKARIHVGVMAQDVKAAFEAEGLVAEDYGVFCSDELEDGSTRLGVRYDELFAFIIGAI